MSLGLRYAAKVITGKETAMVWNVPRLALLLLPMVLSACASSAAPEGRAVQPESAVPPAPESLSRAAGRDLAGRVLESVFTLKAYDAQGEQIGLGSGFVIEGHRIATNAHVVADAAWVEILNQQGQVVSTAPYALLLDTEADLAVLPLFGGNFRAIPPAQDNASTGDEIWVFGAPLGLEGTVSKGIVSARREERGRQFLQITAPISSGSSGGPVVNEQGHLVGVVVAMMTGGQNLNFAVNVGELTALSLSPSGRLSFPSSQQIAGSNDKADHSTMQAFSRLLLFAYATEISSGNLLHSRLNRAEDMTIEDRAVHYYRISGQRGERVKIDVMSNDFDPLVTIVDFPGPEIEHSWSKYDDDSGYNLDSRLTVILPETGDYMIYVTSRDKADGLYLIAINRNIDGLRKRLSSRWVPVSESDTMVYFVDTQTIDRKAYGNSHLWLLQVESRMEANKPDLDRHHSVQYAFRCSERQSALRHISSYQGDRVIETTTIPDFRLSWNLITPGTVIEQISKVVCR
jgi:hypothetical protein